jgi:hypothetical protein
MHKDVRMMVTDPQKRVHLVHRSLHDSLHFLLRDMRVRRIRGAGRALFSSVDILNGSVPERQNNNRFGLFTELFVQLEFLKASYSLRQRSLLFLTICTELSCAYTRKDQNWVLSSAVSKARCLKKYLSFSSEFISSALRRR